MRSSLLVSLLLFAFVEKSTAQPLLPRTLTVHGSGTVAVVPDQARLSMQISRRSETAAAALAAASQKTNDVLAVLRGQGIDPRDIQTSRVSVTQVVDYSRNIQPPPVVGYLGANELTIVFRGKLMEKVGEFVDRATASGAVNFSGMSFESSMQRELERTALKNACADARARAEVLAAECGAMLGRVVTVAESVHAPPGAVRMARMAVQDAAAPVMAGELTISAQVDIVFAIE